MTYNDGISFAKEKGYIVKEYASHLKAFSGVVGPTCAIAINHELLAPGEEKTVLFHELGHCETGSFYNQHSPYDVRQKHENRADKWAIKKLVPEDEMDAAVLDGHVEIWDLAELFGVTEDFMRKAVTWYNTGNISA